MSQLQQTITLNITGTNMVVRGLDQVGRAAARSGQQANQSARGQANLQRNMQGVGRAANNTSRSINNMGGGLRNIQSGMVQLSNYLLILNQRINNTFAKMTRRFTEAESAMTQLKITMGLGGKESGSADFQMFTQAKTQIKELAATTEFTTKEVANAFTALVQSGRTPKEVEKFIQNVLQFTTATGGILSLKDSIDITTLTMGTLGGEVKDVEDMLTLLLRTSQKTKIGFTDLKDVLSGARTAFTYFGGEGVDRAADMMVMAAGLRSIGREGRGAGQGIEQFARAIVGMSQAASKNELFKEAGRNARFSVKRQSLIKFFGIGKLSASELRKQLNVQGGTRKTLRDLYIRSQLSKSEGEGKFVQKSARELANVLLTNYARLVKDHKNAGAKVIASSAFGKQAGMVMLEGLAALAEKSGYTLEQAGDHYDKLHKILTAQEHDLIRAQTEASKTLAYKTQLLDSALNNLSNTMFKHDIVAVSAVDTYKEMISAIGVLMGKNDSLASSTMAFGRAAQFLTSVGANLGFTLVAMATFSTGLTYSLSQAGLATAGFGTTLRVFGRTFLMPTMTILFQFVGALGAVGVAAVALVRYFDKTEGKTESVANTFNRMLNKMRDSAKAVGGMINLVFSKDYGDKGIRNTIDKFYANNARMVKIQKQIKDQTKDFRGIPLSEILSTGGMKIESVKFIKGLQDEYNKLFRVQSDLKGVLKKSGYEGLYALEDGSKGVALGLASVVDSIRNLARGLTVIFEASLIPVFHTLDAVISVVSTTMNLMLTPVYALVKALGLASDAAEAHKVILKVLGGALGALVSLLMVKGAFTFFIFSLRTMQGLFMSLGTGIRNFVTSAISMPTGINQTTGAIQSQNTALQQNTQALTNNATTRRYSMGGALTMAQVTQTQNQATNQLTNSFNRFGSSLAMMGGLLTMVGVASDNTTASELGMYLIMGGYLLPMLAQFYTFITVSMIPALTGFGASLWSLIPTMVAALGPIMALVFALSTAGALLYVLYGTFFGKDKKSSIDVSQNTTSSHTSMLKATGGLTSSTGIDAKPMVSAPGAYTTPTYVATGGERSVDNSTTTHITIEKIDLKTNARNLPQLAKSITRQVGKPAVSMSGVDV